MRGETRESRRRSRRDRRASIGSGREAEAQRARRTHGFALCALLCPCSYPCPCMLHAPCSVRPAPCLSTARTYGTCQVPRPVQATRRPVVVGFQVEGVKGRTPSKHTFFGARSVPIILLLMHVNVIQVFENLTNRGGVCRSFSNSTLRPLCLK